MQPRPGELTPTRWCVVTEGDSDRVQLSITGRPNPDVEGSFTVSFLPPDTIVLSSHTTVSSPVSRLERYTRSEACGRAGG